MMSDASDASSGDDGDVGARRKSHKRGRKRKPASDGVVLESVLMGYLIQQFCWGFYSAAEIQRLASFMKQDLQAAKRAGEDGFFPQVDKAAAYGSNGQYPGNMHRDLIKSLDAIGLSMLRVIRVSLNEIGGAAIRVGTQMMLYPHELFATIYEHYPDSFRARILVSRDTLGDFWKSVGHTKQYNDHPVRHRSGHKEKCIPLVLHSDGVPVAGIGKSWSKMFDIYSWGSILCTDGSTWQSLFLILGMHVSLCCDHTYDEIWKIICWSLLALYHGKWPKKHWGDSVYHPNSLEGKRAGKNLAGGYFATVWAILQDLDNMASNMKLRRYSQTMPCNWCDANLSLCPWSDFRPHAANWINTIYSSADFLTKVLPIHPLFTLPGVTVHALWPDLMHCKYMGTDGYFLGSVLVISVFMIPHMHAGSYQERLNTIWGYCLEYYRDNPIDASTRFRNMRVGMFTKPSRWRNTMPKLKGRAVEIKHLGPALLYAFQRIHDPTDDYHKSIVLALKMSVKMDKIIDDHPSEFVLPATAARDFKAACFVYLNQFTLLADHYNKDGAMIFNLTVKAHMLAHVGMRCDQLNPRRAWCFTGERLMLLIRRIVQSCSKGTTLADHNVKFTEKYRHAMHLVLIGSDRWCDLDALNELASEEADAEALGVYLDEMD